MSRYGKTVGLLLERLATDYILIFTRSKSNRRILHEHADKVWFSTDRKVLFEMLDKLKARGLIEEIKSNDAYRIEMTQDGFNMQLHRRFVNLKLPKATRWDGKWRIVMFDIPEQAKGSRDALRRKLKQLGFIEFQKSAFIYPYSCDEEIQFILSYFEISDHVYLLTSEINPDGKFKAKFKL